MDGSMDRCDCDTYVVRFFTYLLYIIRLFIDLNIHTYVYAIN
jgi:hypothetical protein